MSSSHHSGGAASTVYYDIADPDKNFRGMSYGEWVARWSNWLFSEDPDRSEIQDDIAFLRGNMDYYKFAESPDPKLNDVDLFYDRTGNNSMTISEDTAVFLPVLTSTFTIGGPYNGSIMTEDEQVRRAAREDTDKSGGIWARISILPNGYPDINAFITKTSAKEWESITNSGLTGKATRKVTSLVDGYHIQSSVFKLRISERNPFLKYLSVMYPFTPGETDAVTDGLFLILYHLLPDTSYRIQFGGKGRGKYRTDAIYDLHITKRVNVMLSDISAGSENPNFAPNIGGNVGVPDRSSLISQLRHRA